MASQPQRPSVLTILSILTGLPLALWTYKSLVMVLFQRKIIYMPYLPLGARSERLESVPESALKGISVEQVRVDNGRNVELSGILVRQGNRGQEEEEVDTVVLYFQGNAGTPLMLIPAFQSLLTSSPSTTHKLANTAILSIAPRSYWQSTRAKPTQRGITSDYARALQYALTRFPHADLVVFGHSLGAAAAVCVLSSQTLSQDRVRGLILENPFTSVPDMVRALYPQKYLPYRYLSAFAWDRWDVVDALRSSSATSVLTRIAPHALVIQSEHDEIVPTKMGEEVFSQLQAIAAPSEGRRVVVPRALHNSAWTKPSWVSEVRAYLARVKVRGRGLG